MLALSIRQPYAELILRGIKRIEYRSRPTRIIGERFYIYAARRWAGINGHGAEGIEPGDQARRRGRQRSRLRWMLGLPLNLRP